MNEWMSEVFCFMMPDKQEYHLMSSRELRACCFEVLYSLELTKVKLFKKELGTFNAL